MLKLIQDTLELNKRNQQLTDSLNKVNGVFNVIKFLNDFVTFNGAFAGGVACCAGNVHRAMDMFIDKNEEFSRCADRSAAIATRVFYAAEDEYNNGHDDRLTHREMAQKFIRSLASATSVSSTEHNLQFKENDELKSMISDVFAGYGAYYGQNISITNIMMSLGFHVASELSADKEFNAVYQWLEKSHPKVLDKLKEDNSHMWIKVHCSVEIEHFESAIEGVKLAIQYYNGEESESELLDMFCAGINKFAKIYDRFYLDLIDDVQ